MRRRRQATDALAGRQGQHRLQGVDCGIESAGAQARSRKVGTGERLAVRTVNIAGAGPGGIELGSPLQRGDCLGGCAGDLYQGRPGIAGMGGPGRRELAAHPCQIVLVVALVSLVGGGNRLTGGVGIAQARLCPSQDEIELCGVRAFG